MTTYLNTDKEGQTVYVGCVGEAEHECEEAWEDHSHGEEVPQVHALRQHPGEEHEEGVREEVGGVQKAEVRLCLFLRLSIDRWDPWPREQKNNLNQRHLVCYGFKISKSIIIVKPWPQTLSPHTPNPVQNPN